MAGRTARGAGRRLEDSIARVVRNADGLIALSVALTVAVMDVLNQDMSSDIVSSATLLVQRRRRCRQMV